MRYSIRNTSPYTEIFVNGIKLDKCVAADTVEGWVDRHTGVILSTCEPEIVRIYGKVRVACTNLDGLYGYIQKLEGGGSSYFLQKKEPAIILTMYQLQIMKQIDAYIASGYNFPINLRMPRQSGKTYLLQWMRKNRENIVIIGPKCTLESVRGLTTVISEDECDPQVTKYLRKLIILR